VNLPRLVNLAVCVLGTAFGAEFGAIWPASTDIARLAYQAVKVYLKVVVNHLVKNSSDRSSSLDCKVDTVGVRRRECNSSRLMARQTGADFYRVKEWLDRFNSRFSVCGNSQVATDGKQADTEIIAFDSQESTGGRMCVMDPHPLLTSDPQTRSACKERQSMVPSQKGDMAR
jgi:hypothetical protein